MNSIIRIIKIKNEKYFNRNVDLSFQKHLHRIQTIRSRQGLEYAGKLFVMEELANECRVLCKTMQNTGLLYELGLYFTIFQFITDSTKFGVQFLFDARKKSFTRLYFL